MNIGIVGLGLIGGSLGLKLQHLNHKVFGVTNSISNKQIASKRKLANFISCDLNILEKCSLVILALPIKDLVNPSPELIAAIPDTAIVTDVGSIKTPIVNIWEKIHPLFIGSHPMAGTEKKGVKAGYLNLFDNAKWILTPTKNTSKKSIDLLSKLIIAMKCKICETTPNNHDRAVSVISHLPIFIGASLIKSASEGENQSLLNLSYELASTGFADTSRVGGGNPYLGLDLARNNQQNILEAIKMFKSHINEFEKLIIEQKWELLLEKLQHTKDTRNLFL